MSIIKALSLFSGIGGLDIAALSAGIEPVAMCEIEPFPVEILKKRFPGIPILNDVRKINGGDYYGTIDVVFGGFPCQDLSVAGKQAGLEGERSGLWFEMLRIIREARPNFVLAENVRGAVNLALDTVKSCLEREGYKVWPFVVPASAFGAPHKRERLFVIGFRKELAGTYCQRYFHRQTTEQSAKSWLNAQCHVTTSGKNASYSNYEHEQGSWKKQYNEAQIRLCCRETATLENSGRKLLKGSIFTRKNENEVGERFTDFNKRSSGTLWPTPRCGSNRNSRKAICEGSINHPSKSDLSLEQACECANLIIPREVKNIEELPMRYQKLWATPREFMYKDSITDRGKTNLGEQAQGQLNPDWVEQLMGFPEGWTNPDIEIPCKWQGWPAHIGQKQYPYEFCRTIKGAKYRVPRLKALGNAVVPQQAYPFFKAISIINEMILYGTKEDVKNE